MSLPTEASDYIRKIGEHFISFIHKLDQAQITQDLDIDIDLYKTHNQSFSSVSDYWINQLGTFLISCLSQKYLKIPTLSADSEKTLLVDLLYIRKLLSQFLSPSSSSDEDSNTTQFEIFDTLIFALIISKRDGEIKAL